MDYTIDDLRGKWVNKGTHECKIFLDQLYELGLTPSRFDVSYFGGDVIAVCDGDFVVGLWREENTCLTNDRMFIPEPQWSIYTNDKPLCELSDKQAAALFNAWRGGASVMCRHYTDKKLTDIEHVKWADKFVYRIKQKSERELFIDKCLGFYDGGTLFDDSVMKMLEDAFNAGCRFTEDNNK